MGGTHKVLRMSEFGHIEGSVGDNQLIRVVILGSGNVAEAFARTLADTPNVELRQVMARNAERCKAVAEIGRCSWSTDPAQLVDADLYVISVSDRSVEGVARSYNFPERAIVVHTAGSVGRNTSIPPLKKRASTHRAGVSSALVTA